MKQIIGKDIDIFLKVAIPLTFFMIAVCNDCVHVHTKSLG